MCQVPDGEKPSPNKALTKILAHFNEGAWLLVNSVVCKDDVRGNFTRAKFPSKLGEQSAEGKKSSLMSD